MNFSWILGSLSDPLWLGVVEPIRIPSVSDYVENDFELD